MVIVFAVGGVVLCTSLGFGWDTSALAPRAPRRRLELK